MQLCHTVPVAQFTCTKLCIPLTEKCFVMKKNIPLFAYNFLFFLVCKKKKRKKKHSHYYCFFVVVISVGAFM